jgi:condensin complex subunit 1
LRKIWYGAVGKVTSTIYALHPAPGIFATEIAKKCRGSVFSALETKDVSNGDETQNDTLLPSLPSSKLVRFLFVMSHIALNHLVYSKTSVRKIQELYTRKIESSQPITEDPIYKF